MALEFINQRDGSAQKKFVLDRTVYVDRHGKEVAQSSPNVSVKLGVRGASIPYEVAQRAGLTEVKEARPVQTKETKPSENKESKKNDKGGNKNDSFHPLEG